MSEINAYMNGYQPEGDTEFLVAALEAHRTALVNSRLEAETAKEFLYQHIQTNKGLDDENKQLLNRLNEYRQKAERLEKYMEEIHKATSDVHVKVLVERAIAYEVGESI